MGEVFRLFMNSIAKLTTFPWAGESKQASARHCSASLSLTLSLSLLLRTLGMLYIRPRFCFSPPREGDREKEREYITLFRFLSSRSANVLREREKGRRTEALENSKPSLCIGGFMLHFLMKILTEELGGDLGEGKSKSARKFLSRNGIRYLIL